MLYVPQHQMYSSNENWGPQSSSVSSPTPRTNDSMKVSAISNSVFSPDAPEFVSNLVNSINPPVKEISELPKKKKKRKKKKPKEEKTEVPAEQPSNPENKDVTEKTKSILVNNPAEKPSSKVSKAVQFQESEKVNKDVKDDKDHPIKPCNTTLDYSRLFKAPQKPIREVDNRNRKVPNKTLLKPEEHVPLKPELKENNQEIKANNAINPKAVKPVMSFADKLKSPDVRNPFLDWRDQRTKPIKPAGNNPPAIAKEKSEVPKLSSSSSNVEVSKVALAPSAPLETMDDGFVQVTRKKNTNPTPKEETTTTTETDSKKKMEREKKKLREKEKKKRLRDEKLLSQKLAPKGLKIGLITSKDMENFRSSNVSKATKSKLNGSSILNVNDSLFPALRQSRVGGGTPSRGNASESESEWETTETQVIPSKEPVQLATRSVKRSDPIHFDLMALITKKTNKKIVPSKTDHRKSPRAGFVANILDRSAPVLSRGKIRNKKRKLSEIRKALLLSKAKKKEQMNETNPEKENVVVALNRTGTQFHTKKFREYCDQILSDEIDLVAKDMLFRLRMFQDRAFQKDPIKGRMRKRLVAGLREVTKQVERNRVKIIFFAPDIQRCPETGGLDQAVQQILELARQSNIPIVYTLSRLKIGRVLMKHVPVSCCGILNYQGTEDIWQKLSQEISKAREEYQFKIQKLGIGNDRIVDNNIPENDVLLNIMKLSLKEK